MLGRTADEAGSVIFKPCPNPMPGPSELELRPLDEEADFL
jgi:hypothetical protein